MKFVDVTNDIAFRKIFGNENKKKSLISFLNGILEFEIGNNANYFSCHQVRDIETGEQIIQDVAFYFIELPKFKKELQELVSPIDQWTYFIKNAETLDLIPENVVDKGLKEAYLEAEKHSWTQAELDDYERASIKEQDEIGRIELAVSSQ